MPKQTPSQEIGRAGERWFVSQLPLTWVFQAPSEDVGIDGVVVICEAGPANGLEFRVQIKSSTKLRRSNGQVVLRDIKHSAMRYWVTGLTPTLIVAFETSSQTGFCAWANEILAPHVERLSDDGVSTLGLPMRMRVGESTWNQIRDQVSGIHAAVGRQLLVAGTAMPFLRAINQLSGALKYLYFAEAAKPPEPERTAEQRRVLQELEVSSHRDVVRAVTALDRELAASGMRWGGLTEYANDYVRRVSAFVEGFAQAVATDGVVHGQVIPEALAIERRTLMNSVAVALHDLTQAAVHAASARDSG